MNERTINYVGAAIIALLLFTTIFGFVSNSKNKRNLNAEKLRTESLLSEKLQVQKELDKLKTDFSELKNLSDVNEKLLAETNQKISDNERRIRVLSGENKNLLKNKKELEDLQIVKANLDKEYADLKLDHEKLLAKNNDLQNSMKALETQKNDLIEKLQMNETYTADNFHAFGTRGKADRLVFRAKKLNVNFEVPQSLTEAISFKILTPSGSVITSEDKALTWIISMDERNLTASLSPFTGEFEPSRQVSLNYASKKKLPSGEYKIQLLCADKNIGNCRVRLK
jgi:vacuolar-type H+-ATPase subunit I/STV1